MHKSDRCFSPEGECVILMALRSIALREGHRVNQVIELCDRVFLLLRPAARSRLRMRVPSLSQPSQLAVLFAVIVQPQAVISRQLLSIIRVLETAADHDVLRKHKWVKEVPRPAAHVQVSMLFARRFRKQLEWRNRKF